MNINGYAITEEDKKNNNIYIKTTKITKTNNGITRESSSEFVVVPGIEDDQRMGIDNYIYLASFNKLNTININDAKNSNITYEIERYTIPINSKIMRVAGLKMYEKDFNMHIYDYEFGPELRAKETIINRKINSKPSQSGWSIISTYSILLGGLTILITQLQSMNFFGK